MASLVMMIGGAVINALAFSGSNYMFSKMQDDDRKRHNKALESLAIAQDVYEKRRLAQIDFINDTLRQQGHAYHTFQNVDDAIKEYYLVTGQNLQQLGPPKLSDFYQPSSQQKAREIIFIVVCMTVVYFIAQKVNK